MSSSSNSSSSSSASSEPAGLVQPPAAAAYPQREHATSFIFSSGSDVAAGGRHARFFLSEPSGVESGAPAHPVSPPRGDELEHLLLEQQRNALAEQQQQQQLRHAAAAPTGGLQLASSQERTHPDDDDGAPYGAGGESPRSALDAVLLKAIAELNSLRILRLPPLSQFAHDLFESQATPATSPVATPRGQGMSALSLEGLRAAGAVERLAAVRNFVVQLVGSRVADARSNPSAQRAGQDYHGGCDPSRCTSAWIVGSLPPPPPPPPGVTQGTSTTRTWRCTTRTMACTCCSTL